MHLNPVRTKMTELPEKYPFSSYHEYISGNDDLVTVAPVLSTLSQHTVVAREKYKEFEENALNEVLESPLKNIYGGIILGSSAFIKDTMKRIDDELLNRVETSHRRALLASHGYDDIISIVCERHSVTREDLLSTDRNDLRRMCIYLMKRYAAVTNQQIGDLLGGMSGFAVAKVYQRMVMDLNNDSTLSKETGRVESVMSHVKG
jgi:hypothetical protein